MDRHQAKVRKYVQEESDETTLEREVANLTALGKCGDP